MKRFVGLGMLVFAIFSLSTSISPEALSQTTGSIELYFQEKSTQQPIACRVRVLSSDGREQRVRGAVTERGWVVADGKLDFKGRPGEYRYDAHHGPEFAVASGGFTLDKKSVATDVVELPRHANLAAENWYGGDLLCADGKLAEKSEALSWLAAEQLAMVALVGESNASNAAQQFSAAAESTKTLDDIRWVERGSYWDRRAGSGLVLHHWLPPASVPGNLPSSRLLVMSKSAPQPDSALPVHAEIQRLWAKDTPIWLASGKVDSIQILSEHLTVDGQSAAVVNPIVDLDPGRFVGPRGPGRLVEQIYWQVLESGLAIPPSAGSGFAVESPGRTSSPMGYNRVYAYTAEPQAASWWEAVRAGHTFVTNGPLLRVQVDGHVPGHRFVVHQDSLALDVSMQLTVADPVEYLDVIFNGQTLYRARLDEYAKQGGRIPTLNCSESGWLIVRVVTERDHTYRLASSAPYYIDFEGRPRISRSSVAFFQRWLAATVEQEKQRLSAGTAEFAAAELFWKAAEAFWESRARMATVD